MSTPGGVVGLGVDVVDVPRFRRVLERRPGVATRLFSDGERAYAARFADPGPRLAARFAAKEAAMKALGVGLGAFALRDVEVERAESGTPRLALRGRAAELAARQGATGWHLSLTHSATVALAVATAVAEPA